MFYVVMFDMQILTILQAGIKSRRDSKLEIIWLSGYVEFIIAETDGED
jgi:hypothetical protein